MTVTNSLSSKNEFPLVRSLAVGSVVRFDVTVHVSDDDEPGYNQRVCGMGTVSEVQPRGVKVNYAGTGGVIESIYVSLDQLTHIMLPILATGKFNDFSIVLVEPEKQRVTDVKTRIPSAAEHLYANG